MHMRRGHLSAVEEAHEWFVTDDGVRLHRTSWLPDDSARSNILLIHGHGEYMGRYGHVGAFLAGQGHAVFGFDLRGHGRSEGRTAFVETFGRYVADAHQLAMDVERRHPGPPLMVFGHSLGGLIALHYSIVQRERIAGVIASSPFVRAALPIPRLLLVFANLLSRYFPTLPTISIKNRPLTHDGAQTAANDADPLTYRGRILARTGNEMRLAGDDMRAQSDRIDRPIYVFHGTEDHLADWRGSCLVFGNASSRDKTLTLFPGLYHETLNELNRHRVLAALGEWLDEHV